MSRRRFAAVILAAAMAFAVVAVVSLKYFTVLFFWIWLAALGACILIAWLAPGEAVKATAVNLGAAMQAFALFEAYEWWSTATDARYEGVYDGFYLEQHPLLGYALNPGTVNAEPDVVQAMLAALHAQGMEPTRVSALLPGFLETPHRYQLHEADDHPNAAAYARLAEFVVRHWAPERPAWR